MLPRRLCALTLVVLAIGCSEESLSPRPHGSSGGETSSTAGSGGGGEGGGGALAAAIHFVDGDGHDATKLRYGEAFAVLLDGLPQNGEVRVDSAMPGYTGTATFAVDRDGAVDTRTAAPIEGTYDGAEPEGLLWSMLATGNEAVTTFDIAFSATVGDKVVATATLERGYLDDGLLKEEVTEHGLVGRLYRPANATGPLPALLIMGGSEGGIDSAAFEAAWFAGYGYTALGLAYFAEPGLPPELTDIPLEYFATALDVLAARPDVDPERIGVIGGSRGGELVLMLGRYFPAVHAVVAEVPSGVRWGSVDITQGAAWTYEGQPLPYLLEPADAQPVTEKLDNGELGYRLTPVFQAALDAASAEDLAAATTEVEQTHGPILMLGGEADALWPSCELAKISMDRLEAGGHATANQDELVCFPDAGHFAPLPGWPTTDSYAVESGGYWLVLGGTPKGTAHAEREGLAKLRGFLAQHLQSN